MDIAVFRQLVWDQSRELYRDMLWRDEPSFYHVLVSEIMLQQTQVVRVRVKFDEFMLMFPTIETLASASLADVLRVWQGLGYNRRAKFLHTAARYVVENGVPQTMEALVALPGVGNNTAGAIMNYVYEIPTPFVETNIRTVYLHHFFQDETSVSDQQIRDVVEATLDHEHPREWFWALMDYGAHLKETTGGRLDQSKQHKKQAPLKGSVREVRGRIIRALTEGPMSKALLMQEVVADERYERALNGLMRDGLVACTDDQLHLTNA